MQPYRLDHLLAQQVQRRPDAPAIIGRDEVWSYATLNAHANRLAHHLLEHGVQTGDRVALLLDKSPWAIAAIFGVLKAGAAYVPLDPKAPPSRSAAIVAQAEPAALVTEPGYLAPLLAQTATPPRGLVVRGAAVDGVDAPVWQPHAGEHREPPASTAIEQDLAYILFTSGSTGVPKGVMISHRAALSFVNWAVDYFAVGAADRLSNHAPLHFDLSIFDIFGAVAAGASVAPVPGDVALFPWSLATWIEERAISVWYSVPSALTQLVLRGGLDRYAYANLRAVLFAGEVFPLKHLRALCAAIPHAVYANLYGPTETNVCTVHCVTMLPVDDGAVVPIGRACANCEVFALDEAGRPIAVGQVGELFVRSPTLMSGYWRDPVQSAAVLLPDPRPHRAPQQMVYRTGDMVRLEADGEYCFIGRRDDQVKSRGYRIELGEIELVLSRHPQIEEAAVVAIPDEEFGTRLVAWIVLASGRTKQPDDLLDHCATRLPTYMIPSAIHPIDALPRTSTGKLDRSRLLGGVAVPR